MSQVSLPPAFLGLLAGLPGGSVSIGFSVFGWFWQRGAVLPHETPAMPPLGPWPRLRVGFLWSPAGALLALQRLQMSPLRGQALRQARQQLLQPRLGFRGGGGGGVGAGGGGGRTAAAAGRVFFHFVGVTRCGVAVFCFFSPD